MLHRLVYAAMVCLVLCAGRSHAAAILPASATGSGSYYNSPSKLIDGVFPGEGAPWNSGTNVYWHGTSPTFTIDLGDLYDINDLLVSVDHNDRYRVSHSVDNSTYSTLATIVPSYGDIGWGMDTMSSAATSPEYVAGIDFSSVQARYLRLNAWGGDNAYAVGEIKPFGSLAAPAPNELSFRDGYATYTHDVDSGLTAPPGGLVAPGVLEGTAGSANPDAGVAIDSAPALAHSTTDTDPDPDFSTTANGGLYELTSPGVATLLLPAGVGVGQTDPNSGLDASAFYTDFSANWDYSGSTSMSVFPFMNYYATGIVGDSGFVSFDAQWTYETMSSAYPSGAAVVAVEDGWVDRGTLNISWSQTTPGPFAVPLFTFGTPFSLLDGDQLRISGTMQWTAENNGSPSSIQTEGGGGTQIVPLPAAVWPGIALLGVVGGASAFGRRRLMA